MKIQSFEMSFKVSAREQENWARVSLWYLCSLINCTFSLDSLHLPLLSIPFFPTLSHPLFFMEWSLISENKNSASIQRNVNHARRSLKLVRSWSLWSLLWAFAGHIWPFASMKSSESLWFWSLESRVHLLKGLLSNSERQISWWKCEELALNG